MGKFYPFTYAQKAIWNVEKYAPYTSINNIAASLLFEEDMDLKLLEGAINILLKKTMPLKFG